MLRLMRLYQVLYFFNLLMVLVTGVLFASYVYREKKIDQENILRQQSLLLMWELRQSSDDLTRMVRSYVITGSPLYKRHFQEIMDVRDGAHPVPGQPWNVYWDLVMDDDSRPRPFGETAGLLERMKKAGFTSAELEKLQTAKAHSDELTRIEIAAMRLIEDTPPPSDATTLAASRMLYSPDYQAGKAAIMRPIAETFEMVDRRTLRSVESAVRSALLLRYAFILSCAGLVVGLWLAYRSLSRILGITIPELNLYIETIGRRDYTVPIRLQKGNEDSVVGWIAKLQSLAAQHTAELSERNEALIHQHEEIARLANHDALTGLPSLRLARDRLQAACNTAKREKNHCALLFIDLDGFKAINDGFGHDAGDHVLKEVAARLSKAVRASDTVARLGGDEFLVIQAGAANFDAAEILAKKLIETLALPLRYAENTLRVGCSIGIAFYPDHGETVEDLIKKADDAMYGVKRNGKDNFAIYSP